MAKKKKKLKLSPTERKRRSRQAKKNFKLKTKTKKVYKMGKKKKKKTKGNDIMNAVASILAPIGYGMVRGKISTAINNSALGQRLPVTGYTDEAVMLGINELAKKVFKIGNMPVLGRVSRSVKTIELANIGAQLTMDFWK